MAGLANEELVAPQRDRAKGVLIGRASQPRAKNASQFLQSRPEELHLARAGDLVIVQERYDQVLPLVLTATGILHNRYGRFRHADIIGRTLGRRWDSMESVDADNKACGNGRGFVYVLAPNPALWSLAMLHRTQVVYPHDSAIISLFLELRPGSVLVESGTGAGSAAIAFGRIVAPHGRVLSFEFHRERAAAAAADFKSLGLEDVIRVSAGHDVLAQGFSGVRDGSADAVFLDLPAPYHVIREAARVLRADGNLCSFSPCIEQVQRTCEELRSGAFHSVRTVTAPTRTYETRVDAREAPGFEQLCTRPNSVSLAAMEAVTVVQNDAAALASPQDALDGADSFSVARRGDADAEPAAPKKRKRVVGRSLASERLAIYNASRVGGDRGVGAREGTELAGHIVPPPVPVKSRAFAEMKGHTSYLTFAKRNCEALDTNYFSRPPKTSLMTTTRLPTPSTGCNTM